MPVFKTMSDQEIQKAQEKLNELCNEHGVGKFNIQDKVGLVGWQKLVRAMCGIDGDHREKPGKKAYSQEFIWDVGARIDVYRDFIRFDNEKFEKDGVLEQVGDTLRRNVSIYTVADELQEETGKKYEYEQVRGIYDRYRSLRKKRIEDLENDPYDPDEMFENME